jgi:RNA polymerase sigma-70 factor (sigma-E family)
LYGVMEFEAFFRVVFPKAVGLALRISGDRSSAEDAAVEALARAHMRWRRIGDQPWAEAWVMRVTVNEAIRALPRPQPVVPAAVTADPTDAVVLRHTLSAALHSLPRRQCEVIVLRYLLGLSEPEVADVLGVSLGTVKTHLRRGLAGLRTTVAPTLKEEHLAHLV